MNPAQLARVAAIRPPPPVRIYVLDSPHYVTGLCMWLCAACEERLRASGWTVNEGEDPPECVGVLPCQ